MSEANVKFFLRALFVSSLLLAPYQVAAQEETLVHPLAVHFNENAPSAGDSEELPPSAPMVTSQPAPAREMPHPDVSSSESSPHFTEPAPVSDAFYQNLLADISSDIYQEFADLEIEKMRLQREIETEKLKLELKTTKEEIRKLDDEVKKASAPPPAPAFSPFGAPAGFSAAGMPGSVSISTPMPAVSHSPFSPSSSPTPILSNPFAPSLASAKMGSDDEEEKEKEELLLSDLYEVKGIFGSGDSCSEAHVLDLVTNQLIQAREGTELIDGWIVNDISIRGLELMKNEKKQILRFKAQL